MKKQQFLFRRKAASVTELGLLAGLIAIILISAISATGTQVSNLFSITGNNINAVVTGSKNFPSSTPSPSEPTEPAEPIYHSCKELYDDPESPMSGNGIYEIKPDGSTPINVYCYNRATLITAQFENDALSNWGEGIQPDYDPTLASKKSFTFNAAQIPAHDRVYFGSNYTLAYCLEGLSYTTGNLAKANYPACSNPNTLFVVYRKTNAHYSDHNPDKGSAFIGDDNVGHNGALEVEIHQNNGTPSTGSDHTYAFAPNVSSAAARGYSMGGYKYTTSESYAWTIWVE